MEAAEYRRELYLLLERETPFTQVEDWIDEVAASGETKAGLWLLAWAEQDRGAQRRIADEALAAVDA